MLSTFGPWNADETHEAIETDEADKMDKAHKTDKVQEKDGYVVWNKEISEGVLRSLQALQGSCLAAA